MMADEGFSVTGRRLVGYALRWGAIGQVRKGGENLEEVVKRGSFAASIAAGGVRLCIDHDYGAMVASQADGTLTLVEDHVGLLVDAVAHNTEHGDLAMSATRSRSKAGLSVGFVRAIDNVFYRGDVKTREIIDCHLREVSVCRNPCYRSSEIHAGRLRIERFLADSQAANRRARLDQLARAEAEMAAAVRTLA
ncbi:HK97 family phage prohead protease [Mesorhizobium sp. AR07]|uniref:HK97 family phage prohead protease n=1 Tax=Mesorhizobium sp. AR07 TaxID=2865838 RepID=UPI0021602030|nr:HK97 family phage prohead protease [Mesorhizobium sp. AR07]UVK44837.1 HK97 family phage prohead protease [Mesorhizobium sp. AR07]